MATHTSNYGWTKPSGSDNVDISVLNNNLDDQDSTIHDAFLNMAPPFSESSTYAVDNIVLYGTGLYKCHTAVVTPGSWTGSTNWQVYKLSEGGSGGGGGTSDYNPLTNKPQINGVTLIGNKTTSDLGITASGVGAIPSTDKGANGGVAELDSNGKVPSSQLPSYVDDVLSYASQSAFPATGESGKIYIAEDTNKTYRWSGSAYAEISESLALGETSSTAYRGDRGKTAYDHSQTTGNPHGTTAADVGLGNVPNVSTNDQTPTFTEASTRNNIASGEKLSVIMGKIAKFFNDLKTVAFTGSFSDLTDKPNNSNTFQGTISQWNQLSTAEKKAYDHASIPDSLDGNVTFPASKVMLPSGTSLANGVTMTKLWENPSPSASFAAQSLQIDLTEYNIILTLATNGISALNGTSINDSVNICEPVAAAGGLFNRRRLGYITATGITFNDCYKGTSLSAGSVDNGNCVPLVIYGIKIG
jgi:hypothetical protein